MPLADGVAPAKRAARVGVSPPSEPAPSVDRAVERRPPLRAAAEPPNQPPRTRRRIAGPHRSAGPARVNARAPFEASIDRSRPKARRGRTYHAVGAGGARAPPPRPPGSRRMRPGRPHRARRAEPRPPDARAATARRTARPSSASVRAARPAQPLAAGHRRGAPVAPHPRSRAAPPARGSRVRRHQQSTITRGGDRCFTAR